MKKLFVLCLSGFLVLSCKSKPVPELPRVEPYMALVFEGVRADDPENLILDFTLNLENPFSFPAEARIESWEIELNGQKAALGFDLESAEILSIGAGSNSFPLILYMDISALAGQGLAPADSYSVNLINTLSFSALSSPDRQTPYKTIVSGLAEFPGLRPPSFSITSIAILKAELINTRFRVSLKIENPNPFPLELSAFNYELYGNGRLWADGSEKNVLRVNGKSSLQGNLFLLMNFINMKRDLLDQIIRLEDVNYRFEGEALVTTGVEYLPRFTTSFKLSGYSHVFDN